MPTLIALTGFIGFIYAFFFCGWGCSPLSTIHDVKGQTHDGALVMETRYKSYDMAGLINRIACLDASQVTAKVKLQFSRQLYVAASRPKHLLCFAERAASINDRHKEAFTGKR